MAGLGDVEKALGALAFGFLGRQGKPGAPAFAEAWAEPAGRALVARNVTLLHCTTEYPAPFDQINLRAMDSLSTAFGLPTGLSDHSVGISVAIAAAARGAAVVEKHFTLDRGLPGPDHQASLEPAELSALVAAIRQVERALGDGVKTAQPVEIKNMAVVRKCLVTSRPVRRGEAFSQENLTVKRAPGTIPAEAYWDWLGRLAGQDYDEDEVIAP
jgi:sialic acid synthase SpsE